MCGRLTWSPGPGPSDVQDRLFTGGSECLAGSDLPGWFIKQANVILLGFFSHLEFLKMQSRC